MWSKEKTIEWEELGSKGKYKKRLVNKKNSCFEKNTNTYITVFSTFFITYLAGSVFFKHFAFRDIDQWRFFLNSL